MKRVIAVAALMVLAGCTSITPVTPAGQDTYLVGVTQRGGFDSFAEVKAKALQQAEAFCEKRGKHMQEVETETHGVRGWTPQEQDVTFRCMP